MEKLTDLSVAGTVDKVMLKTLLMAAVFLTSLHSLAGTIDPSVSDQKHIEYGEGFKCVVQIEGLCTCGKGNDHLFNASAVAISPSTVLTAAHVVKGSELIKIRIGEDTFKALKVIVNEGFKENNVGYHDIAMCHCEGDFGLDFYPELYEDSDEISKVVSMAGYGMTGTFSTGADKSDKKKRAGSNIVRRMERDVLVCDLGDRKTALEFMIAPGDSGGGLFIGNKLAGINSFVMADDGKTDSDYGDECAHTRISKFIPWIRENMKK